MKASSSPLISAWQRGWSWRGFRYTDPHSLASAQKKSLLIVATDGVPVHTAHQPNKPQRLSPLWLISDPTQPCMYVLRGKFKLFVWPPFSVCEIDIWECSGPLRCGLKRRWGVSRWLDLGLWVVFQEFNSSPMDMLLHLYQTENEVQLIPGVVWEKKYIFLVRQMTWKSCCHGTELQKINVISKLACLSYTVPTVLTRDGLGSFPWGPRPSLTGSTRRQRRLGMKSLYGFLLQIKWLIPAVWPWPQHN